MYRQPKRLSCNYLKQNGGKFSKTFHTTDVFCTPSRIFVQWAFDCFVLVWLFIILPFNRFYEVKARCVGVFAGDFSCVALFQSEEKPPTLWGCLLLQKYQRSKGAFTLATFWYIIVLKLKQEFAQSLINRLDTRQRNEQTNECKANKSPLDKKMARNAENIRSMKRLW